MTTRSSFARAALGCAAVSLLAACSGTQLGTANPGAAPAMAPAQLLHGVIARSGVDTRYAGSYRPMALLARPAKGKVEKDLFVSDAGSTVQILKNKTYNNAGAITGLGDPDGLWTDKSGNLYVAEVTSKVVAEFAPGSSTPKCTYSSGLVDPINVTTDAAGNVFVADFNDLNTPGYVDEFKQCKDAVTKQFSVSSGPEGLAVDAHGNLFVSFFNQNFNGGFEEFKKGQKTPTALTVTTQSPGGMAIDSKGNLIADDQAGSIVTIAPPYSSAVTLVSGLTDPFHVSLNKAQKLLFNANVGTGSIPGTVTVYKYPSGALVTTLGTANGLDGAEGVSDAPNAVF